MNTKICSRCGEKKLLEAFKENKDSLDGRASKCKRCASAELRQAGIITQLLRTRNLGGGQQGVMEWHDAKPQSEIPLSGDHFKQAFGVAADGPEEPYSPTKEAYSREVLEEAINELGKRDPKAYIAINTIFDPDIGGFRDIEFYSDRAPATAREAVRGIFLLAEILPPENYRLYVEKPRAMTDVEEEIQYTKNRAVVDTWNRRKAQGARSKDVVDEIRGIYGISERRIYQILEQEAPTEDEPTEDKPKRGRPRKGEG